MYKMKKIILSFFVICLVLSQISTQKVFSASFDDFNYLSPSFSSNSASSTFEYLWKSSPEPTSPSDFCMEVPVFLYHHTQPLQIATLLGHPQFTVDSNIFDEQIRYLKENNYNIISAEDLVAALKNFQKLPEKTVLITVDDGYDDNYTYAFSIAKKYKVIMNFMIPTGLIGNPGYMTWEHLKEMKDNPYARIYNHTASHAALAYLSQEQVEWELNTSSEALKKNLGLSNTIFTYPYGSYNDLAIDLVKKHGFTGAFTTIEGQYQCRSQIMELQRLHVGNATMNWYGF